MPSIHTDTLTFSLTSLYTYSYIHYSQVHLQKFVFIWLFVCLQSYIFIANGLCAQFCIQYKQTNEPNTHLFTYSFIQSFIQASNQPTIPLRKQIFNEPTNQPSSQPASHQLSSLKCAAPTLKVAHYMECSRMVNSTDFLGIFLFSQIVQCGKIVFIHIMFNCSLMILASVFIITLHGRNFKNFPIAALKLLYIRTILWLQ